MRTRNFPISLRMSLRTGPAGSLRAVSSSFAAIAFRSCISVLVRWADLIGIIFSAPSADRLYALETPAALSGRLISSNEGTWVLFHHDSSAAPQTVQTASPVCGTKNFASVRLYSAPQLHRTIVAISGIGAPDRPFSSPEPRHIQTDPPTHCRAHDLHARRTRDLSSIVAAHKFKSESDQ